MPTSYANNAISAKTHAMYGHRLTPADYDAMVKMSSVPEVAAYLQQNTHYADVLTGLDPLQVHRGQLEANLRNLRFDQYTRLIRYNFAQDSRFYTYIFLWEEIQQILNLLRYLGAGSEGEYFLHYSQYLPKYCSYDIASFPGIRDFQELLQVLDGTPYERILRRYPPRETEEKNRIDLVSVERELTTYYYQTVLELIRNDYSGKAREALEAIFLAQIDAENITNAYRLRRFFKSSPEEIRKSILPFDTPSRKIINRIIEAESVQDLDKILSDAKLVDHAVTDEDFIESLTLRIRYKASKKDLRYSVYPSVVLVAYMIQLEIELENVINIIEAIRYNLSPQDVRKLLIL